MLSNMYQELDCLVMSGHFHRYCNVLVLLMVMSFAQVLTCFTFSIDQDESNLSFC